MRWPQEHLSVLGWPEHITALFLVCWLCTLPSDSSGASGLSLVFTIFSIGPCVICHFLFLFWFWNRRPRYCFDIGQHGRWGKRGCLWLCPSPLSLQICFCFELPGSPYSLEYFLVFQLDCFFEDISFVRLRQTYIQYFAWVSSLVW